MATDSGVEEPGEDHAPIADRLSAAEVGDVLLYGPAMTGKGEMGLELLVAAAMEAEARPFYVSTSGPGREVRARLDARIPDGASVPEPGIVVCSGTGADGELLRRVSSPGDLTGIAAALSDLYGRGPRSARLGAPVLVDNVSDLLVAADLKPVCRLLHVLSARVGRDDGVTVATLDTDGLTGADRPALTGLFDTVVRVRRHEGRSQYRLHADSDWHGYLLPEDRL